MDKMKKMHEILNLVMEINEGFVKRQGKGHPTAFFSYSGHINICEVEIHLHGWIPKYDYDDENEYLHLQFNFNNDEFSNYNFARLKGIVKKIKDERSNV